MWTLGIASKNTHKIAEFKQLLAGDNIQVLSIDDLVADMPDVAETGGTFSANAILKIRACPDRPKTIYLSDDSGLEVHALNGEPGVYSARYAGPNATADQLCDKVLGALKGQEDRRARFVCVIALKDETGQIHTVEGTVDGEISLVKQGRQGFAYDPIFRPKGFQQTFAEMSGDQKNRLSHRGQAMRLAKAVIDGFLKK